MHVQLSLDERARLVEWVAFSQIFYESYYYYVVTGKTFDHQDGLVSSFTARGWVGVTEDEIVGMSDLVNVSCDGKVNYYPCIRQKKSGLMVGAGDIFLDGDNLEVSSTYLLHYSVTNLCL